MYLKLNIFFQTLDEHLPVYTGYQSLLHNPGKYLCFFLLNINVLVEKLVLEYS